MRIYNLILISASCCIVLLCSLHGPGPGPVLCMIRERHVILKAAFHSGLYSCLAAASYIIMLYCLVYSFKKINVNSYNSFLKINVSLGNLYNYSYINFIYLHSQAPALYIIMIL